MTKKIIYLDNASTTKVLDEVIEVMNYYHRDSYGNPSSLHQLGIDADNILLKSKEMIAKTINAKPEQIIFTSGGTESNNLAIKGSVLRKKGKIITTKIEHPSVLNVFKDLEKNGFEGIYLNVDREGFVDLEELKEEVNENTLLISIIHANNEIGTIQNIKSIVKIIREKNKDTLIHSDACQSYSKMEIDVQDLDIDLMTINSHKIHGPNGVGALFIKNKSKLKQIFQGGHQENNLRPGTENIPAIIGFAKAAEIMNDELKENVKKIKELQNYTIQNIENKIKNIALNGPADLNNRLCNNINFTFKFIEGEGLLMLLNEQGICVSTGSACSSQSLEPSHTILALGKKHEDAHGTIRFSLSKFNTKEEIDFTIEKLIHAVDILRKLSHISKK